MHFQLNLLIGFAFLLPSMMFAFGDPEPQSETMAFMELMVINHILDVVCDIPLTPTSPV